MPQAQRIGALRQALIDVAAFESAYAEFLVTYGAAGIVEHMTTTAEPRAALTPARISRLDVPEVESLRNDAVRGFFTRQQREEGLTSNSVPRALPERG